MLRSDTAFSREIAVLRSDTAFSHEIAVLKSNTAFSREIAVIKSSLHFSTKMLCCGPTQRFRTTQHSYCNISCTKRAEGQPWGGPLWMNFSLPPFPLQLSSDKPSSRGFITVGNFAGNFPLYRGIWYYAECLVRESLVSDAIVDVALSQHTYLYRQTTFLVMAVRLA